MVRQNKNSKYNLDKAKINPKYQCAISDEVEGDESAKVSVEDGVLLLIKGLAENDLFSEQLSEELVNIGTSMK